MARTDGGRRWRADGVAAMGSCSAMVVAVVVVAAVMCDGGDGSNGAGGGDGGGDSAVLHVSVRHGVHRERHTHTHRRASLRPRADGDVASDELMSF